MKSLPDDVIHFFKKQGFAIVSTLDKDATIHNACKGILKITSEGEIYLIDLYQGKTYHNLIENPAISITAADEHTFTGFSLKGRAQIISREKIEPQILKVWDEMIVSRLTRRLLKNIRGEKGHPAHPEAFLPKPRYMIKMETEEIVDLTPKHLT
jgi:predicted pyridoxine 5'-phosphate oxidase superfamily flavin-nucleotide-binding protein